MCSRLVIAIAALLYVGSADAQEKKDSETVQYKVEFHIQDSADTAKGPRRYSMLIDANSKGTFALATAFRIRLEHRQRNINTRTLASTSILASAMLAAKLA